MIDLKKFNNSALVKPIALRDYRLEVIPTAIQLPPIFSLRDKMGEVKMQGTSGSCVAQATAYYVQLLNYLETGEQKEMSARDIYSMVCLPDQPGAYIPDAFKKVKNSGCVTEAQAPSYLPNSNHSDITCSNEQFMRNRADITQQAQEEGMTYVAKSYVTWDNTNVELYKQAILQGNGMVAATWGNNACFSTDNILMPDTKEQMVWRHALIFIGWDDTKKRFEFFNSWNGWGQDGGYGWLPYAYIENGYVSNPMTLIDQSNAYYGLLQKLLSLYRNLLTLLKTKK